MKRQIKVYSLSIVVFFSSATNIMLLPFLFGRFVFFIANEKIIINNFENILVVWFGGIMGFVIIFLILILVTCFFLFIKVKIEDIIED